MNFLIFCNPQNDNILKRERNIKAELFPERTKSWLCVPWPQAYSRPSMDFPPLREKLLWPIFSSWGTGVGICLSALKHIWVAHDPSPESNPLSGSSLSPLFLDSLAVCEKSALGYHIISSKLKPSANSLPPYWKRQPRAGVRVGAEALGRVLTHFPCDFPVLCSLFFRSLFFHLYSKEGARPGSLLLFPKLSSVKHHWTLPLLF